MMGTQKINQTRAAFVQEAMVPLVAAKSGDDF